MTALVSLSGGMDSATVLAKAIVAHGRDHVSCVGFRYGSKHEHYEMGAARLLSAHYQVRFDSINLSEVMEHFNSNLLKGGGDIPEGHYTDASMSKTPHQNVLQIPSRRLREMRVLRRTSGGFRKIWEGRPDNL